MMDKGIISPLFYLPNTVYFSTILRNKESLLIEKQEHFPKQTYRNRTSIASPNGKLDLVIPVIKGSKVRTSVKDVKISYDFNWQRLHWLSIQTSYRSSSWFEFYEDDFVPFYEKKYEFLFDYNEELFRVLLKLLKMDVNYQYTSEYEELQEGLIDLRLSIHPKNQAGYDQKPYFQLFADRTGFIPGLSVVDLLFSQGPQSKAYL